jgi:hypothetical protein
MVVRVLASVKPEIFPFPCSPHIFNNNQETTP